MDFFDRKSIEKERLFFNQLKRAFQSKVNYYQFFTGKGRVNFVEDVTHDSIYIRTKKGKQAFRIKREKLREAIRYIFFRRTATRKELEGFSKFSSAIMGLMRLVFFEIAKINKTKKGLLRLTLKDLRFIPSGADRSVKDLEIAKEQGFHVVMFSYFNLMDDPHENWRYTTSRLGLKVLVDSGAFSIWQAKLKGQEVKQITVQEYASFIRKHRDILYGWFNLRLPKHIVHNIKMALKLVLH